MYYTTDIAIDLKPTEHPFLLIGPIMDRYYWSPITFHPLLSKFLMSIFKIKFSPTNIHLNT